MTSLHTIGSAAAGAAPRSGFPVDRIREDFPILNEQVRGKPLVYLDNAATSQKPRAVLDTLMRYYTAQNANVHRGVHYLSEEATREFEAARGKVRRFVNAPETREIIFTRGTTEAINLVAQSYGRAFLKAGDEIVISTMEHHSNIVPWQMVCEQVGATLRVIPITDAGELMLDEYAKLLNERTKLVSIVHISNALGTINPVKQMAALAHQYGAVVLVDGAQAAPHLAIDVRDLDCDFYAFSGHKVFGPTGIGVLYGKAHLLEVMPPYQGGGDMIATVTFEQTTYNALPYKFEAGTPHVAGVVGLGAALDYVSGVGLAAVGAYEHELLAYATELLGSLPRVRLIGTAREKASVLSFVVEGVHAHDVGTILDNQGIAVRAGHHCAMPLMQRFGVAATARASLALYNTRAEVEALAAALDDVIEVFG
jgi:cysteine desulfurase / selenocysteine lyase